MKNISIAAFLFFIPFSFSSPSKMILGTVGAALPNSPVSKAVNDSSGSTPPVAILHIDFTVGAIPIWWRFDASDSYDAEDSSNRLMVRWDFEGDGIWDTEYSAEKIVEGYEYDNTSKWTVDVRLQVLDTNGMTADTIQTIIVPSPYQHIYQTTVEYDTSTISLSYYGGTHLTLKFNSRDSAGDSLTIIKFSDFLPRAVYDKEQFGYFLSYFLFKTEQNKQPSVILSILYSQQSLVDAWRGMRMKEDEFVFAFFDEIESRWKKVPTTVDTAKNLAESGITQLYPLWALTQKSESLITAVAENKNETTRIVDYHLFQNYPNPFNPRTTIRFDMHHAGIVRISVYNLLGQRVTELANDYLPAGSHERIWDASAFASGIYLLRLNAEGFSKTIKITLVK